MLKKHLFIALFVTAFMFPFFRSINNADALGSYGCYYDDRIAHVDCLRGKLDTTAYGLTIPKGSRGLGNYGCGVQDRVAHVNCLRSLLDMHSPNLQVRNPGTNTYESGPAGAHPPEPYDDALMGGTHDTGHCAQFAGAAQTACYAAANSGPPAGGTAHCDTFRGPAKRACMEAAIRGRP